VVLVAVLLLAGAAFGAWWLLRDTDRNGAPHAVGAVEQFLRAVYQDQDAAAASALVCSEARDEESLEAKISSIRAYGDTYASPRFTWSEPEVVAEASALATVAVTVTMITSDEKTADQLLQVSVLDKSPHGWWVCDLQTVPADEGEPEGGPDEETGDEETGDEETGDEETGDDEDDEAGDSGEGGGDG
jgi:hypothetical protein